MAELKIDIIAGIDKLSASLKEVENKFGKLGGKLTDIGGKLSIALTAPILAMGAISTNEFSKVEKGLREINTLFGLTGAEADKNFSILYDISEKASKELGILQSDVVPGIYNAISAGVPQENVFTFIQVAGKAAIGGVTDLNTAVDGLTSIVNAFGLEITEAGNVADSMFAAVQGGKTTFNELSASIFNIAPAAAAAGVSFQEVNAAIATLTAGGTPTAVATTQIRAALTGLQRPSEELDAIFQKLGFQSAQFAIEQKGLGFALDAVKAASEGNNGKLQTLLGSTEAVAAANVLAGTGAEKFTIELERQANAAGSAVAAFEEVDKSLGRQLERSKVAIDNLAISFGESLAPALEAINNVLVKVIGFLTSLSPTTQRVIIVFAALAAAIGPVLFYVGTFIEMIPVLTAGLAAVKTALLGISGPVALVIAGIAALAIVIISNWDAISEALEKSGITQVFIEIIDSVKELANAVENALSDSFIDATGSLAEFYDIMKPVVDFIVNNFIANIKFLGLVVSQTFGFMTDIVKGDFSNAFTRLEIILAGLGVKILTIIKPFAEFFKMGDLVNTSIDALNKSIATNKASLITQEAAITKTTTATHQKVKAIQTEQKATEMLNAKQSETHEERIKRLREEASEFLKTQNVTLGKVGTRNAFSGEPTDISQQVSPERLQMMQTAQASILAMNTQIGKTMPGLIIPQEAIDRATAYNIAQKQMALDAQLVAQNMNAALFVGDMFGQTLNTLAETGKVSFQGIFDSLKQMVIRFAAAIAAAITLNILTGGAVMTAGKAAGAKSGFGALLKGGAAKGIGGLTPFAAGGIVSGPTAALVGEYPGARNNPEVIAPLNKLQNMMGGNVTFTISGDNLVGTLNRANKTRQRKF
jgi:TP901 family phage tail tape measure protein